MAEADKLVEGVKIAICTHAFDSVDFDVHFNHIHCIATWARKYDMVFVGKKGLDAARARNQMIERCFEKNCTHAFFIDADHLMPAQALDLLLESKDEAMVSGLVCKRGEGFPQVGWLVNKEGKYLGLNLPLDGQTYDVGVCAFGCTLINLKILKKLKKPYFRDTCEGPDATNTRSDVNICNMFRDIGEKVWIDVRVLVGHLGIANVIYPQNAAIHDRMDKTIAESRLLREGQEGVWYER